MKKILILENDIDTLDIVELLLEENGFSIHQSRKKMPIEEIVELHPDVILLDYLLDDGYGSDICLALKSNPATNHIPIILFSARNNVEQIATACKADRFIAKPFDIDNLVRTVKEMLA